MHIHVIQHQSFESLGAIATWASLNHHDVNISHLYLGEPLPSALPDIDLLIVMGGPQSPATTREQCAFFDAAAEIALIKHVVAEGRKVLGICLGAQLLGEAFGARFSHSEQPEIGLFPVQLTDAANGDPFFAHVQQCFPVGHWHNDMPGLSHEAVVLANSAGCSRQIVRYSPKAYGFQCHFEFTTESMTEMLRYAKNDLARASDKTFIQTAEQLVQNDYSRANDLLCEFLDYFEAL